MNFNDMLMFLGRLVGLTLKIDRATHSITMHKRHFECLYHMTFYLYKISDITDQAN